MDALDSLMGEEAQNPPEVNCPFFDENKGNCGLASTNNLAKLANHRLAIFEETVCKTCIDYKDCNKSPTKKLICGTSIALNV
jgi:hypothetical protein